MKRIRKIGGIIIMLIIGFLLTGCSLAEQQEAKSVILNAAESAEVINIKAMTVDGSTYTLGELIDSALGAPTYELYDPAEDGNRYVTIKGNVEYLNTPVVAALQYKDVGNEQYEFYTLTFNDVPQNQLVITGFFDFLEESLNAQTTNKEKASTDMNIYKNDTYGYDIKYPQNWGEAEESPSGDGCILYQDDSEDIRVFASYMMEGDLMSYINSAYDGWDYMEATVEGATQAYKLVYEGEESYQTAVVAEKNGSIFTFMAINMYIDADYSDELRQAIIEGTESAEMSFRIY